MGVGQIKRAVFLDRDGVLNRAIVRGGKAFSPRRLTEFIIEPRARTAVQYFREMGFLIIVVTNQPDIARGLLDPSVLMQMHDRLRREIAIDEILTCPHDDHDGCDCRKPADGLLRRGRDLFRLDLKRCYLVGDSWKDMHAARSAGCCSLLIDAPYNLDVACDHRVSGLEAVAALIQRKEGGTHGNLS